MKKLLYDATFIAENVNSVSRTGIYFVAYNVLKGLLNYNKFNITLYCEQQQYNNLLTILKEIFPNNKFNIITNEHYSKISKEYFRVRNKKELYKKQHKYVKKFGTQIRLILLSLLKKIDKKIFPVNKKVYSQFDLYLSPMHKVPDIISEIQSIKKYIILYDTVPIVIPDLTLASQEGCWYDQLFKSLNTDDNYFAISEHTRNDFLKYAPQIDLNKITTTLLACNESFKPKTSIDIDKIKQKYKINKKYIFSLCTLEPRKNLIRTVKTFIEFIKKNDINDLIFVLGGGHWQIFIDELNKEINNLGDFKDKILKIGYVDDEDLPALYSGAEWFVYTSQYEGFGLPPLEAISCGCPVITSNNSSLPEVVGDAGIMIDWDSDEQHIKAYEKYYYDENYRKDMAEKGLVRSKQFSWEKCVNQMIEVMTK